MKIDSKNINENIKVMAAASGISLAEVARRVGDSPQQLAQKMKLGKMQKDFEYLQKIADACGYNFEWDFVKKE